MPFLQIFADQLSQTAASLPGANVKHPSSAAVWAYAHLDPPVGDALAEIKGVETKRSSDAVRHIRGDGMRMFLFAGWTSVTGCWLL